MITRTLRNRPWVRLHTFVATLIALAFPGLDVAAQTGGGPSDFCHVVDGTFTDCDPGSPGNEEWSDITPTLFDAGVLYVDQADLDPVAGIPGGTVDHLMLMYESSRTIPLGPDEYVLIHFMTVDPDATALLHYAVRVYSDNTVQVFIDGIDQGPGRFEQIDSMRGGLGFGPSPTNPVPHVLSEFQIGLTASGLTACCYSPDPAWWSSTTPPPPPVEPPSPECEPTVSVAGDRIDNDCDGRIDEEAEDGIDNDGDGLIDEDLALPPGTPPPVGAITITFNAGVGGPVSYTEADKKFTSLHPFAPHLHFGDFDNDGDVELRGHAFCCSHPYQIERVDGQPFTLLQMDVVQLSGVQVFTPSGGPSVQVTSTGTFIFPDTFKCITSALWDTPGSGAMIIDNLVQGPCEVAPSDRDDDGVPDPEDNCPSTANPDQEDSNLDGIGDACQETTALDTTGFLQPNLDGSSSAEPTDPEAGEPPLEDQLAPIVEFRIEELGLTFDEAIVLLENLVGSQVDLGLVDPEEAGNLVQNVIAALCVRTQGFWKNHPVEWPVDQLTLGTVNYDQTQLLAILNQPVEGNGLVSLAHQLIAAKLNQASGAPVPQDVQDAMDDADALIDGLVVPPGGGAGIIPPDVSEALQELLDDYNNGLSDGPPECVDEEEQEEQEQEEQDPADQ